MAAPDTEMAEVGVGEPEAQSAVPPVHDFEKHNDAFNAVLAKAVQESIITLQQSLRNDLKKKMRIKLVALWAAAHACRGVDWKQLKELTDQCKINDDSTLAENLELVAGLIGSRQKSEREDLARANLGRAKSDAQSEKFQAELDLQEKSLPRATLCPALKGLIKQQEAGALDRLTDAERGGEQHMEPHSGASLLAKMIADIHQKDHVMLHEPTLAEWRSMGLYQYEEMAEVWPEEFRLVKAISVARVREWIEGGKANAAIDGKKWWHSFARKCGYVERDGDGTPRRDAKGNTIPLVFDDRFQVDHLIMSSSAHESKDYLLAPILDHPDNYMIVYKGPNQSPYLQKSFGKLCILKAYLLDGVGAGHVTNAHQHRQRVLELNRQALQKATKKVLSEEMQYKHLKPYTTAYKANQEKNMKRLLGTTRKQDAINAMFANAPKRARVDESDDPSSPDAGASSSNETADTVVAGPSSSTPPPGSPEAEEAEEDAEEEEEVLKVPGNGKGPMLKPDGSVPVAGEQWTGADGTTKWRVCESGQACAAKHSRIHVYKVTSGAGNKSCSSCAPRSHGQRPLCKLPGCTKLGKTDRDERKGYCMPAHKQQHEAIMAAQQQQEGLQPPPPTSAPPAEEEEEEDEEEKEEEEEEEEEEDGARTPPGSPSASGAASWMDAFPAEYRTQPGLEQTAEAFARQKVLERRGKKRFYPKQGLPGGNKNGASRCNALVAGTNTWCDKRAADKPVGKHLIRCSGCGAGRRHHGKCPAAALLPGEHKSGAKTKREGTYQATTVAINCCAEPCAMAVAMAMYKHRFEGVAYPNGFVPSAQLVAACRGTTSPVPEPWMVPYHREYLEQPGLPQTAEAFAQQKVLDERGYVRKYAEGKHDAGRCNAMNADGDYCETMCGRTDGKLHRCMAHGGPEMRGTCPSYLLSDAGRAPNTCKETGPTNNGLGSHKGEHWCGRCCNDSCAANVAKAIWEHKKDGVAFPNGFVELARKRTSDSSFDF